jgi:plastocyanin
MRARWVVTATCVVLALSAVSAPAANQTVTLDTSNQFSPAAVTVTQGETVTWNNNGGFHNVHFDDDSFMPPPQNAPWTVSRTFNTPGSFRYYCDVHGGPGGMGMSGTVIVEAAGGTPPPPGKPGPTISPSADTSAPNLKLAGPARQRVVRQRAVFVFAKVDEASTVTATGSVSVPGISKVLRLKKVTRKLAANVKARLALRLSKKAVKSAGRALTRRSLTAKVIVTAKDSAGNTRSAKRKIRLKA